MSTYIELGCILEPGLAVTWDQNLGEVALSGLQSTLPLFHYMRFCSYIPSFPWWHCSKMYINLLSLVFMQKIVTILNLKSDIFKSNIMVKKTPPSITYLQNSLRSVAFWNLAVSGTRHLSPIISMYVTLSQWYAIKQKQLKFFDIYVI